MHDVIVNASSWVKKFAPLIPKGGMTLDLACGSGRHAELLASMGHQVLAVDQDVSVVESLGISAIIPRALNLEGNEWPLVNSVFSGIIVTNYLYRPYLDELPKMLPNEGVLIYETFAQGNGEFGKPSNPNFLLNSGELLAFALRHSLKVLAYEDIYVDQPKPAMVQRLCAVKGQPKQHIPLQFRG
jgi:SAM-dependent methyltransferase